MPVLNVHVVLAVRARHVGLLGDQRARAPPASRRPPGDGRHRRPPRRGTRSRRAVEDRPRRPRRALRVQARPRPRGIRGQDARARDAWHRRRPDDPRRPGRDRDPRLGANDIRCRSGGWMRRRTRSSPRRMPDARNVLVVADARRRPAGRRDRRRVRAAALPGIERRVASMVGQLASMAALNLRNAVLLRHVQDLAERDSLTGAANRRMFQLSLERVLDPQAAPQLADTRHRRAVHRPRRLQGRQRHARSRSRRRPAGRRDRADRQPRPGERPRGPARRRRVRDPHRWTSPTSPAPAPMADRLVEELRAPYVIDGPPGRTSARASASRAPATRSTARRDLVRNADVAMYMAKANGKAGFAVFDPGMHVAIRDRNELGVELQARGRARPASARLPADRRAGDAAHGRRRGARPLGPPDARHRSRRDSSSRSPRRTARSCRSAAGSSARRAAQAGRWQREGVGAATTVLRRQRLGPRGPAARASSTASRRRSAESGLEPKNLVLEITETALLQAPRRRRSPRSTSCARSASGPSSTTSGPATSR